MSITEFCGRGVVTVEQGASLQLAASLMRRLHVGTVVVVEGHGHPLTPVGILTDRDIVLRAVAENMNLETTRVGEIMTKNPVAVRTDARASEVIGLMQRKGIRRVLVVDEDNRLYGLLSSDDLIQTLGNGMSDLGLLFKLQARNEDKYIVPRREAMLI